MNEKKILIHLEDVKMYFEQKNNASLLSSSTYVKAVDGITLDIYENETLGLVGESGSGKSTLGKLILNLYNQSTGDIIYSGQNIKKLPRKKMRQLRKDLQVVFQDPYASLNPRMTVGELISESLIAHKLYKKRGTSLKNYTLEIMEKCGLQPYMLHRYPHQFSGGQRQRIGIARALALNPRFVVCDEAVSTLDVSIQSQIINLLLDLKEETQLTYLFISHDLSTVRFIADRIAVMYLGNIVELAPSEAIFETPLHPYTKSLLDSIPSMDTDAKKEITLLEGEVPSPIDPPTGCKFHPRCKNATPECATDIPSLREHSLGHFIACHHTS